MVFPQNISDMLEMQGQKRRRTYRPGDLFKSSTIGVSHSKGYIFIIPAST
jgi:hypothetical protein